MISARDPASMTESDRLSEMASLFAAGYLRLLLSRRKALEAGHPHAALCVGTVNGQGAVPGKEHA
jgi:hypothetical protein